MVTILSMGKFLWTTLSNIFSKRNQNHIHVYLYYMSFLHIDMTQVVEILPQVKQGYIHST